MPDSMVPSVRAPGGSDGVLTTVVQPSAASACRTSSLRRSHSTAASGWSSSRPLRLAVSGVMYPTGTDEEGRQREVLERDDSIHEAYLAQEAARPVRCPST